MTARPSLGVLAIAFSRIGAAASGGLGATIALLRADLIERRGWCDDRDVSEALALTKPLPGSTVVQIVAFLGWRLGGWFGCAIAAASFVTPAAVIMAIAAAATFALPIHARWVAGAFTGIQAAVIGLLASAMWKLARSEAAAVPLTLTLTVGLGLGLAGVNAAAVVVLAGLVGIVLGRGQRTDA